MVVVVRCPRCGSMDAASVEETVEISRMRCSACGHEELCDMQQIKDDWNERIPDDRLPPASSGVLLPSVRFEAMWRALGGLGPAPEVIEELRCRYGEPDRAYHDATHIAACLRLLDDPDVRELAARPAEVEATVWFHDAIYDTHASDNEDRSAELAVERLRASKVAADAVERIASSIRATKDHVATSSDAALVIDVDLSILGERAEVFERFEQAIRREYGWVETKLYAAGRTAVLRKFLERPVIYHTPWFRDRFERAARSNIATAIERLATTAGA